MRRLPVLLLSLLLAAPAVGDDSPAILIGRVVKVVDGDTLDVQLTSGKIRVRLHAVDAPEKAQPHGKQAAAALAAWVLNNEVEVEPFQQDRYDRLVAIVYLAGKNMNAELVRAGHAWAFRRYMKKADSKLCSIEASARTGKKGLWSLPAADRVAPWEHRARKTRTVFTDYGTETVQQCVAAIGRRP